MPYGKFPKGKFLRGFQLDEVFDICIFWFAEDSRALDNFGLQRHKSSGKRLNFLMKTLARILVAVACSSPVSFCKVCPADHSRLYRVTEKVQGTSARPPPSLNIGQALHILKSEPGFFFIFLVAHPPLQGSEWAAEQPPIWGWVALKRCLGGASEGSRGTPKRACR